MLIQVCASIPNKKVLDREIRALLKAKKELNCETLIILTGTESGTMEYTRHEYSGVVQKIPLWKWFSSSVI